MQKSRKVRFSMRKVLCYCRKIKVDTLGTTQSFDGHTCSGNQKEKGQLERCFICKDGFKI